MDPSNPSYLTWMKSITQNPQIENTPFIARKKGKRILFSGSGRLATGHVVEIFVVPARNNKNADADMSEKKSGKYALFCHARGSLTYGF